MESKSPGENLYIIKERRVKERLYPNSSHVTDVENNPLFEKFAAESFESFYNYVVWLGLANDPDSIILPSANHFYYDAEDLKDIRTVFNLRQLNNIKQIREHLNTIYSVIPDKCFYIGFFIERKNQNDLLSFKNKTRDKIANNDESDKKGITSSIPFINLIYNIMDSRFNRLMTKRGVTLLLENAGLKVLDITELNGITYFCTQKVKHSSE
jgi:hypothetical protein